jgi:colanic acid/amylovoran biosynthesis glycosyltransferase
VIAYITSVYPSVSHSFIVREVEALRQRGIAVSTVSGRRTPDDELLSEADWRAFESTWAILPPRWGSVAAGHLTALVRHPLAYGSTLRRALSMGRQGLRGRLWQIFYFGEAVIAWRHWRRLGVRHVHAHFPAVPADVALLASHFGRVAGAGPDSWSFTVHGCYELSDVRWFAVADKIRSAAMVVCVSDFTRSQLMALVDASQWNKLHVVRCGVRPSAYAHVGDPRAARPRILCVARLVAGKGQEQLLEALATLSRRGINAELELVGDGPNRASLEEMSAKLQLRDRVMFTGSVAQDVIAHHYQAATVFCLPSFGEGVPTVLMEAMACGRPVVATAVGGVSELVRDGETGMLVSPARPDQLTEALQALLEDAALRRRLGEAGRREVVSRYDIDRNADQVAQLFKELLGDRTGGAALSGMNGAGGAAGYASRGAGSRTGPPADPPTRPEALVRR